MPRGNLFPCFAYDDAPRAIEFLERAFGFKPRLVVPGPNGTIRHSQLEYEGGVIMVSSPRPGTDWAGPGGRAPRCAAVCVLVRDPDAHCARARAAGAVITREVQDEEYGSRGYMAKDSEGNEWYFGTYEPGVHWTNEAT
jgi:uncharacterized glyoxalase superfamily protein PhnB